MFSTVFISAILISLGTAIVSGITSITRTTIIITLRG